MAKLIPCAVGVALEDTVSADDALIDLFTCQIEAAIWGAVENAVWARVEGPVRDRILDRVLSEEYGG